MEINKNEKKGIRRQTIIGRESLAIVANGNDEYAAQFFSYNDIREVRLSLKDFEVKVLMNYDESYYRVFKVFPASTSEDDKKKATLSVTKFYNDLLNSTMKLTKEELENIRKQREKAIKEAKEKSSAQEKEIN